MSEQPTILGLVRDDCGWYGLVTGRTRKRWRIVWLARWDGRLKDWDAHTEGALVSEKDFEWVLKAPEVQP